jgi:hypothetical protein
LKASADRCGKCVQRNMECWQTSAGGACTQCHVSKVACSLVKSPSRSPSKRKRAPGPKKPVATVGTDPDSEDGADDIPEAKRSRASGASASGVASTRSVSVEVIEGPTDPAAVRHEALGAVQSALAITAATVRDVRAFGRELEQQKQSLQAMIDRLDKQSVSLKVTRSLLEGMEVGRRALSAGGVGKGKGKAEADEAAGTSAEDEDGEGEDEAAMEE